MPWLFGRLCRLWSSRLGESCNPVRNAIDCAQIVDIIHKPEAGMQMWGFNDSIAGVPAGNLKAARKIEGRCNNREKTKSVTYPLAACKPNPLEPPVTTATFPCRENMFLKSLSLTCSSADMVRRLMNTFESSQILVEDCGDISASKQVK
jgi:hypothetical protein